MRFNKQDFSNLYKSIIHKDSNKHKNFLKSEDSKLTDYNLKIKKKLSEELEKEDYIKQLDYIKNFYDKIKGSRSCREEFSLASDYRYPIFEELQKCYDYNKENEKQNIKKFKSQRDLIETYRQKTNNKKTYKEHINELNTELNNLDSEQSTGGKRRTRRRRQRSNKKRTNKRKKTKTRMKRRKTSKRKTNKRRRTR